MVAIEDVRDLGPWLDDFLREAGEEGAGFVDRLAREWRTGENRFSRSGEHLIVAPLEDPWKTPTPREGPQGKASVCN